MNKKGMSWNVIVTAIIVLVVLLFLIWIFRDQISAISSKFLGIINQTGAGAGEFSDELDRLREGIDSG
jgi:DNA-binding transcriptional regulator of glucitol operon